MNKIKYLTSNSIRFELLKRTSTPYPVKSLGYIKHYSLNSPIYIKSPCNSIQYNCQKIYSWSRWPETILEIRKKTTILKLIHNSYYLQVFQRFTNHRNKTNGAMFFCCRRLSNILTCRDHRWNLPSIWETRYFGTFWRVKLTSMEIQVHSSSEPPPKHNQDQTTWTNEGWLWPF